MRARLAYASCAVAVVAAVPPWFATHTGLGLGALVIVLAVVTFVTLATAVVAALYGAGHLPDGAGWTAAAVFVLVGLLVGGGQYYLTYLCALLLALAVAAGEPLRPPDPGDDRLTRPMPRRDA